MSRLIWLISELQKLRRIRIRRYRKEQVFSTLVAVRLNCFSLGISSLAGGMGAYKD